MSLTERRSSRQWRGDRVAEGARLEIVCRGNSTVGSNPTLSAMLDQCVVDWIDATGSPLFGPGGSTEGDALIQSPVGACADRLVERCQSGRMGRSRKPLTVHAVRGFESHPLRHFPSRPEG